MDKVQENSYSPKEKPFDSFKKAYGLLQIAGYTHLLHPRNKWTETFHHIYRHLVLFGIVVYIVQHSIFIVQVRDDVEKAMEGLILTIPEIFLFFKAAVLLFGTNRLKRLISLMNEDLFAAHSEQDEEIIRKHTKVMHSVWRSMMFLLTCIVITCLGGPVARRLRNGNEIVSSYMPFKQDTWPKFILANFLDTAGFSLWSGYGHFSVDSMIGTYFAQARLQLQIINHNLEHLFDGQKGESRHLFGSKQEYIDVVDETVQKRFVFYVRRYDKVVWYTNKVNSIFNFPISFHIITATLGTCLGVYQMSSINVFTPWFFFCLLYYIANQAQIFVFCHFAGMIEHESKLLADSIYQSEWTSLSPRFRKQIIIAMCRWLRPITPTIAGIIPLSHATFLTITRSAYTMYTVLKTRNSREPNGKKSLTM